MLFTDLFFVLTAALARAESSKEAAAPQLAEDSRVKVGLTLDVPCNGVSATSEGRLFVLYSRADGSKGPQLVEWNTDSKTGTAYPNSDWNSYADGKDAAGHFVHANAQRIGPDGHLWVVDAGAPSLFDPVVFPGGPKLVKIDLKTNKVAKVYGLGNATLSCSYLDDIRFNPKTGKAYITDAGSPALIVIDLESGFATRILEYHRSTRSYFPASAEGNILRNGSDPVYVHADQLEVSVDAKYLFYQPKSGGMWRLETHLIDQALYNASVAETLYNFTEPFAKTPTSAGTAIDADGTIYTSDTDRHAILKIHNNGTMTEFVRDPRLLWADAMWIDKSNRLWVPAAQINRGVAFNDGKNKIVKPLYVFTIDIGVGPSAIDHA